VLQIQKEAAQLHNRHNGIGAIEGQYASAEGVQLVRDFKKTLKGAAVDVFLHFTGEAALQAAVSKLGTIIAGAKDIKLGKKSIEVRRAGEWMTTGSTEAAIYDLWAQTSEFPWQHAVNAETVVAKALTTWDIYDAYGLKDIEASAQPASIEEYGDESAKTRAARDGLQELRKALRDIYKARC
jgi:hypothetical protein